MFRAMFSPTIRSTWLYLEYVVVFTQIAAGWCLWWVMYIYQTNENKFTLSLCTVRQGIAHKFNSRCLCAVDRHMRLWVYSDNRFGDSVSVPYWQETFRILRCSYESNKLDATIQVTFLFLVSSTCFGQCFRPSSGALDCIYSIW